MTVLIHAMQQNIYSDHAQGRYLEIIKHLIKSGANLNAKDNDGKTALMYAVDGIESLDIVKLLINSGADVNIKDNDGENALDHAYFANADIRKILQEAMKKK